MNALSSLLKHIGVSLLLIYLLRELLLQAYQHKHACSHCADPFNVGPVLVQHVNLSGILKRDGLFSAGISSFRDLLVVPLSSRQETKPSVVLDGGLQPIRVHKRPCGMPFLDGKPSSSGPSYFAAISKIRRNTSHFKSSYETRKNFDMCEEVGQVYDACGHFGRTELYRCDNFYKKGLFKCRMRESNDRIEGFCSWCQAQFRIARQRVVDSIKYEPRKN